jgi:hypothetical protein
MRKISIILTALTVSANIYAQSLTEIFDEVFQNVSRANATTGILYERVLPFAGLHKFNSNQTLVDTSNKAHFMQAYFELYNKISNNTFKPQNIAL